MAVYDTNPDVVTFIRDVVRSRASLEVLLLLFESAGRSFTAASVARRARLPFSTCEAALSALCASGLLSVTLKADLHYAYAPGAPGAHQLVEAIAAVPRERLARLFAP